MKRKLLAGFMAVCLILTLLPATALAADDDGLPTASEKNFFANGTSIIISESAPEKGEAEALSGLTTGTSAYISWDDNGTTKYVGVPADVVVWGGGDGSQEAVTVSDTSITMTGGTVYRILGGNFGTAGKGAAAARQAAGDTPTSRLNTRHK